MFPLESKHIILNSTSEVRMQHHGVCGRFDPKVNFTLITIGESERGHPDFVIRV